MPRKAITEDKNQILASPPSRKEQDAKLFKREKSHRFKVKLLKNTLIGLVFFILLCMLLPLLKSVLAPKDFVGVKGKNEDFSQEIALKDAHLEGYNSKGEPYKITAKKTTQKLGDQNILLLSQIEGSFLSQKGQSVHIKAEDGVYDRQKEQLFLSHNIVMWSEDGFLAHLNQAMFDMRTKILTAQQGVDMRKAEFHVLSEECEADQTKDRMIFSKNVHCVFQSANPPKGGPLQ